MARKSVRVKKAQPNVPAVSETETLTGQEVTAQQRSVVASGGEELAATTDLSSVTKDGITWTFEAARPVGQYANGDYFVVGPVTITQITPESVTVGSRVMHGTTVDNVGGNHGYDSYDNTAGGGSAAENPAALYREERNLAPSRKGPLVLSTGSVVSSISLESPGNGRPTLAMMAILTVVENIPAEGAFRPSPFRANKDSLWTESQLDYSILRSLAPTANVPNLASNTAEALRYWNWDNTDWTSRPMQHAGMQSYGRAINNRLSDNLLLLQLNYTNAEKRDLFVGMVQIGLDIYERLNGPSLGGTAYWYGNGSHNSGRYIPCLLAGLALNDSAILAKVDRNQAGTHSFVEIDQIWPVVQVMIDTKGYAQENLGQPEWIIRTYLRNPYYSSANPSWSASYRWTGSGMVGASLAARMLTGGVAALNNPVWFGYTDRYFATDTRTVFDENGIQAFQRSMWQTYRDSF